MGSPTLLQVIDRAREDALRLDRGYLAAFRRLIDRDRTQPVRAVDIMSVAGTRAVPTTPVGVLLPMIADGDVDAAPVLEKGWIVGIVTRTDLIAALARSGLRAKG
ncbi:hypothetical protein XM53_17875 [Roseovarius atlanticus]|uniref:CBS domain-containing protein n=1 Tax=Roseovarius atlanticus TaxID=1641875 RepID=A0A0T5NQS1_9RHOB|nr:CBS domain-containing protein [Roseovarius atlanticus]KRS11120.1 hypothetical protein XM53_17875 [Roseovarius atlanticus]